MASQALIFGLALLVLILLAALLVGQGAANDADRLLLHAAQTQIALPTARPRPTMGCPIYLRC